MPQGFSYAKWDKLELSDDEDFECHPNVDKASMVRWKQTDLHRKRRDRQDKIAALKQETAFSQQVSHLLTGLNASDKKAEIVEAVAAQVLEWDGKLKHDVMMMAHTDRDPRWQPPTPDPFFMKRVDVEAFAKELREKKEGEGVGPVVTKYLGLFEERRKVVAVEVKKEEDEINSKITTETIKDGFNKTIVAKESSAVREAPEPEKKKKTVTTTTKEIVTLNNPPPLSDPTVNAAAASAESSPKEEEQEGEKYITDVNAEKFSQLSQGEVPVPCDKQVFDEILAQAFHLEMEGKKTAARRCVHQSLVLQYCEVLGKDGIRLFFTSVCKDVADTYQRISDRVKVLKKEEKEKEEKERLEAEEEKRLGEARVAAALQEDGTYKLPVDETSTELEIKRAEVSIVDARRDEINEALGSWDRAEADELLKQADAVGLITLQEEGDEE
ncbi:Cdc37 N terminal kinase binding-domain-containing protein [Chytridium lagenaria]|nr:Cdc37 N terminal kinase binding-domain-containing protein [Chytridium lagenaria]